MAKAHSPLRLEAHLVEQASISGKLLHRSTAEQIEYWADIGRNISKVITPELLLQVYAGVAKVKVEKITGPHLSPDALFSDLENDRKSGALQNNISTSSVRYQASPHYPGYLERIDHDGTVTVGQFKNGNFKPLQEKSVGSC